MNNSINTLFLDIKKWFAGMAGSLCQGTVSHLLRQHNK